MIFRIGSQCGSYDGCDKTVILFAAFARKTRLNLVNPLFQFFEMRASPVNLPAAGATAELLVMDFCKRFEFLNNVGLGHRLQRRVAAEAARKWSDKAQKVETADHLDRLFVGILGTRTISVLDDRVHEQTPITRQERAVFARHDVEQLPVISVLTVGDIKTEHAKITLEAAQMAISYKSSDTRSLQSFFLKSRITILDRKDLHVCVVRQRMIEADRPSA